MWKAEASTERLRIKQDKIRSQVKMGQPQTTEKKSLAEIRHEIRKQEETQTIRPDRTDGPKDWQVTRN